jgi:hypothetical protein
VQWTIEGYFKAILDDVMRRDKRIDHSRISNVVWQYDIDELFEAILTCVDQNGINKFDAESLNLV